MKRISKFVGLVVATPLFVIACASDEPGVGTDQQAATSDAATGGTPGFYFLPPLVDPPTFSGTFDGSFKPRLKIDLVTVDCGGTGVTGATVFTWNQVMAYPATEQYKVGFNVGASIGVSAGNCYRVTPKLDNAPLGFRDVAVISGPAAAPPGYRKWGLGANQTINFRLENMDPDGDGVLSHVDNCPLVSNPGQEDSNGNGIGDACDVVDSDGDGVPDSTDNCPLVANAAQDDTDADGTGDACDGCALDPGKTDPGVCGCGVSDVDTDLDGTPDCSDGCPTDPGKIAPGVCGCGVADVDSDGDGLFDCVDACPFDPANDADGDGVCGDVDACPLDPNNDADGDGVCGDVDNCPSVANPGQEDGDGDGIGDACEPLCADVANAIGEWTGDNTPNDSRGGNHGVWSGLANYAAAVVGAGFAFDTTNYVVTPFTYSGAWSISLWARANASQVKNTGLIASAMLAASDTFQIDWGPMGQTYRLKAGVDSLSVNIGTPSTSAFQHLVVTYDGASTIKTYLDGVPVATGSWSGPVLKFSGMRIGINRGNTLKYNGVLDDVTVFSRTLSDSEVAAIHTAAANGICP